MGELNCLITHAKMPHQTRMNLKPRSKARKQTDAVEDRQRAIWVKSCDPVAEPQIFSWHEAGGQKAGDSCSELFTASVWSSLWKAAM